MRIITGTAKGTTLTTLDGLDTRPTPERVKEAIFSMLQFDIEGRRVLDLFAGSGQLALEALSRGATEAVLIDRNPQAISIIKENAKRTKLDGRCEFLCCDSFAFLKNKSTKKTFDIIFVDPPYALQIVPKALEHIEKANILATNGIILCETEQENPPIAPDSFILKKHVKYGRVHISVYQYKQEAYYEDRYDSGKL